MPRKTLVGCTPRTLKLREDSYYSILEFFNRSPEGITGTEAIRTLIHRYGVLCQQKLDRGKVGGATDLAEIKDFVDEQMEL